MKKLLYSTILVLCAVAFASCEKEEVGNTETKDMAGQWYVTVDAVDDNGEVVYEDLFDLGRFLSLSYNTNKNVATEMYVSDLGTFWDYQVKVTCDPTNLKFSTSDWADNEAYDCKVRVTGGQITVAGAMTPSGQPADSIVYYVEFDDDPYPEAYGFAKYRVQGYRYTGFTADE